MATKPFGHHLCTHAKGWLHPSAVLDMYLRKIVVFATASAIPTGLVCAALQKAITQINPSHELIVNADRSKQYASAEN
jgi:transposase InsO family protein